MKSLVEASADPRSLAKAKNRLAVVSSIILWLAVVVIGLGTLWSYENAPGKSANAPSYFPADSEIKPAADRLSLVMFAHPQCPCTRASLEELDKLMTLCHGRMDVYVLLMKPKGYSDEWVKADLWNKASVIPGVTVLIDEDGIEARRFGAATSGQVILYGTDRRLLFHGGITGSRGHIGDNAGRSAIESLVNIGSAESDRSIVFGCPLFNPESECRNVVNRNLKN